MPETPSSRTRLYVDQPLAVGEVIALTEAQFHQLKTVQRLETGAILGLFDGVNGGFVAELRLEKKSAVAVVTFQSQVLEPLGELTLLFAPIKSARLDFLVEKATELGVTRLRPVLTDRTQGDRVNVRRLRETVREAAEQCGRLELPRVDEPEKLVQVLEGWNRADTLYFCAEAGAALPLHQAIKPGRGAVLIGPEGGFSPAEFARLRSLPFVVPVSLGPRILRAETAAIAALACWQAIGGDWQSQPDMQGEA